MKARFDKIKGRFTDTGDKKRLALIYIFCMILPLVIADGFMLFTLYNSSKNERLHEMQNIANSVMYDMEKFIEEGMVVSNNMYLDSNINDFLETYYESDIDCFAATNQILSSASFGKYSGFNVSGVNIYADNDTLVGGGVFHKISDAKTAPWYDKLKKSGRNMIISIYFVGLDTPSTYARRRICLVRNLDYYKSGNEKILAVELDYKKFARDLSSMNYAYGVYVCQGDTIICSNRGHSGNFDYYSRLTGDEDFAYVESVSYCGDTFDICITGSEDTLSDRLKGQLPLILLMIIVNLFLPVFVVRAVYGSRIERQEADIARQNAELLALHSQINPHFLFNVLESIRMRCIMSGEDVTAGMIEKLAVLERQAINWGADLVTLEDEMNFIRAYLELQKYRFGDRLHYDIDLPEECMKCYLPKLTLTVFVENSCVHGMENKSSACWIYVRAYIKDDYLILEVEDTGDGMDDDVVDTLNKKMSEITIDGLKETNHVGILNSCLRLKMYSDDNASFMMESEKGAGTFMTIKINNKYTKSGGA